MRQWAMNVQADDESKEPKVILVKASYLHGKTISSSLIHQLYMRGNEAVSYKSLPLRLSVNK